MPVNELVRLVRVYSTPWEEKSAALKKLHEDYESKQRQLNIAIKRLQLVDAHVSGKTAVAGIFSSSDDDYNNHFSSFAKVTFILLFCLCVMFSFSFLVLVCKRSLPFFMMWSAHMCSCNCTIVSENMHTYTHTRMHACMRAHIHTHTHILLWAIWSFIHYFG